MLSDSSILLTPVVDEEPPPVNMIDDIPYPIGREESLTCSIAIRIAPFEYIGEPET